MLSQVSGSAKLCYVGQHWTTDTLEVILSKTSSSNSSTAVSKKVAQSLNYHCWKGRCWNSRSASRQLGICKGSSCLNVGYAQWRICPSKPSETPLMWRHVFHTYFDARGESLFYDSRFSDLERDYAHWQTNSLLHSWRVKGYRGILYRHVLWQ